MKKTDTLLLMGENQKAEKGIVSLCDVFFRGTKLVVLYIGKQQKWYPFQKVIFIVILLS